MGKLSIVLQAVIIVLLAVVIALIIYYGTSPPKNLKGAPHAILARVSAVHTLPGSSGLARL